jgi:hypothetical protein
LPGSLSSRTDNAPFSAELINAKLLTKVWFAAAHFHLFGLLYNNRKTNAIPRAAGDGFLGIFIRACCGAELSVVFM